MTTGAGAIPFLERFTIGEQAGTAIREPAQAVMMWEKKREEILSGLSERSIEECGMQRSSDRPGDRPGDTRLAMLLMVLAPAMFCGNMVVARATAGFIPPVALAFWRWTMVTLLLLPLVWRDLRH